MNTFIRTYCIFYLRIPLSAPMRFLTSRVEFEGETQNQNKSLPKQQRDSLREREFARQRAA